MIEKKRKEKKKNYLSVLNEDASTSISVRTAIALVPMGALAISNGYTLSSLPVPGLDTNPSSILKYSSIPGDLGPVDVVAKREVLWSPEI